MSFCPNCGNKLDGKVKFCPNCGAPVTQQSQPASSFGSSAGAGAAPEFGQQISIETDYSRYSGYEDYAGGTRSAGTGTDSGNTGGTYSSGTYSSAHSDSGSSNGAGAYGGSAYNAYSTGTSYGIKKRNIALCIIFTIITFGIYGLFWMAKENDDINQMSGEVNATGGGMVVLLSIVTCGIYALYWYYKMGERTDRIKGTPEGSTGLIYLLLSIFGLSIVSVCLIQDTINRGVGRF